MTNKERKIHTLIGTCLAAALPCLGLASPPSDAAVGQIDSILNFCARSVPSLEENAQLYRTAWIGDASPGARNSKAYKEAYQDVSEALEKGNQVQEVAACTAGLRPDEKRESRRGHRGERAQPVAAYGEIHSKQSTGARPLAFAEAPTPNARVLGVTEGALNYCGPLDPGAADRLRQAIKRLVQGASDQQLAEVRNSDEYRKAYDSVVDFTAKIDEHNVKRFCAETPVGQ